MNEKSWRSGRISIATQFLTTESNSHNFSLVRTFVSSWPTLLNDFKLFSHRTYFSSDFPHVGNFHITREQKKLSRFWIDFNFIRIYFYPHASSDEIPIDLKFNTNSLNCFWLKFSRLRHFFLSNRIGWDTKRDWKISLWIFSHRVNVFLQFLPSIDVLVSLVLEFARFSES